MKEVRCTGIRYDKRGNARICNYRFGEISSDAKLWCPKCRKVYNIKFEQEPQKQKQ